MAIEFIGSAYANASSVVPPSHQAGDYLLFFAYQDTNNNAITVPGHITRISYASGGDQNLSYGFVVATSSSTTSGTWTNAAYVLCKVYRGVSEHGARSNHVKTSGFSQYRALSMQVSDGSSWVVGFIGHKLPNIAPTSTAPSGMLNRGSLNKVGSHDTNGGVSAWSLQSVNYGTAFSISTTLELKALVDGFEHLDISGPGFVNAASGSGNYIELSNSGYIRKAGTEGAGALILDASGNIIVKGS